MVYINHLQKLDRVNTLSKLSQMPGGVSPGFGNNNLDAVNKLREHWHKGQNAIIIDDHVSMIFIYLFILFAFHLCLSVDTTLVL